MLGLNPCSGACAEQIVVDTKQVLKCPEHLSKYEAAALPLAGLTAYRAVFSKCGVKKDNYVLVTGVGGGVALLALQFAVAVGANVYVTSSSPEMI
jgi:NADPH:quinone reductase-like Zn-dependent oxidoreductase